MTDNEIIKALECCYKDGCKECPLWECKGDCFKELIKHNVLDLINRQKAEIERLKKEVEVKSQKRANFFEIIDAHEKGRTRAIKEFWDKAKQTREFRTCPYVYVTDGDNLVKEMTEQKE